MNLEILFLILFGLLILSAFFSGAETSIMSVNRYKLKHKSKQGDKSANNVDFLVRNPEKTLGLILLMNNFVNILASAISTLIAIELFGEAGVALSVIILTVTILIFAEVTPKTFAALYADKIAYPISWVLYPLLKIFNPIVIVINLISQTLLRILGIKKERINQELLTKDEIKLIVKESSHRIPKSHEDMIVNMIDLEKVKVEDAMIPKNEIYAIDMNSDESEIYNKIISCNHTRIPFYNGDINKILGFLHKRKIMLMLIDGSLKNKDNISDNLSPAYFIPEDTSLTSQLIYFKRERKRMGFVVNEYGEVQGLVTLDDILEEIVGDFNDSSQNKDITKIRNNEFQVRGTVQVREINKVLGWKISEGNIKTINGYILEYLENIPIKGEKFTNEGYDFEIMDVSNNFVNNVKIKKK